MQRPIFSDAKVLKPEDVQDGYTSIPVLLPIPGGEFCSSLHIVSTFYEKPCRF